MRRMWRRIVVFALIACTCALAKDDIEKRTLQVGKATRTYYVFAPTVLTGPAPLILLLHGSGRNGRIMVDMWKDLATKEGIVLVAPDALESSHWGDADGPPFLHAVIDAVRATQAIDAKRIYIFGHSAGAVMGLLIAMIDSEYFAATAVHAGVIPPEASQYPDFATRKMPIKIFVGTNDPFFPLSAVRATRDLLAGKGFPVELTEIRNHTHDYYYRAKEINRDAWEFLKRSELPASKVTAPAPGPR